ncbi:MAG: endonuclease III [Clostridia bacterium]|nr:endonuclease III [Clostridia bacterium]
MSRPLSKKKKTQIITETLYKLYPEAECSLEFDNDPFRLLVMARLSAQCTDARVNIVSKELFRVFPDVHAMACASYEEIEEIIKPCGLFRTKAKSIKDMSVMLIEKFGGEIPSGMDELLSLPGVGRKIANLIRGDHFGLGGIVADTHCIRLSNRFGLAESDNPAVVERELSKLVPNDVQSGYCHRMVYFGRDVCKAQNPRCSECPLKPLKVCIFSSN